MYLQKLHHIRTLVEHLLQLMEDDVVAVGTARVRSHGAEGEMEALAVGVPLNGDGAALGGAVAQYKLTVIIQPDL